MTGTRGRGGVYDWTGSRPSWRRRVLISEISERWPSTMACAAAADVGVRGVGRGPLGHLDPADVVGDHQPGEPVVEVAAAARTELLELGRGRHPRHVVPRRPVPHPRHGPRRRVLLVPLLEDVVEEPDLGRLRRHDLTGEVAEQRIGAALLVGEPHLHRLLVVRRHVVEEPDVDGVAVGVRLGQVGARSHPPSTPTTSTITTICQIRGPPRGSGRRPRVLGVDAQRATLSSRCASS